MSEFLLYPKKKAILLPASTRLPEGLEAREVSIGNKKVLAVRDNLNSYYALRDSIEGLENPIYRHYDWPNVDSDPKKPAMQHQKDGAAFILDNFRSWNTSEMGTGKSVTLLYAANFAIEEGIIKSVLVLSPLSTLNRVWADTLFNTFLHTGYQYVVLHGPAKKRAELLAQNAQVYIANHDFIKVATSKKIDAHGIETYSIKPEFKKILDIDLILFDESACLRNGDTYLFKAFKSILQDHQRLVLATGTPTPTAATDVFWPSKLVNPKATPKYFSHFRRDVMYSTKKGPFEEWHNRDDAAPKVFAAMQPCFRVAKKNVLDLPPVVWEKREVELTSQQEKAFKSMLKDMTMTVGGKQVDAVNAAAKVGKLHQILCGSVKDDEEYIELDCKPRLNVVMECIEESLSKTIVVVPYKGILRHLTREIRTKYKCAMVNGDVKAKDRDDIFKQFVGDPSLQVLLVHPKVMSHGLTFVQSSSMVFYSAIRGNEQYRQVLERMARPGQKNKMTIVQIGGHALEWKMYKRLDEDENFQQSVLAIYNELLEENC